MDLETEARLYAVEQMAALAVALLSGNVGTEPLRAMLLTGFTLDGPIEGQRQARLEALDRLLARAEGVRPPRP